MTSQQNPDDELTAAIFARDIAAAKKALVLGAAPRVLGSHREAPLLACAKIGFLDGAKLLLPLSDRLAVDANGWNALMAAAASGHAECCALLADEASAASLDIFGHDALMLSADARSLECARILMPFSEPNRRNRYQLSARDIAMRQGASEIAEFIQQSCRIRLERRDIASAIASRGQRANKHRI